LRRHGGRGWWRLFAVSLALTVMLVVGIVVLIVRGVGIWGIIARGKANRDVAEILGIDTRRVFMLAFCAGSALAALAGALVATMQRYIPPRALKPFPVLLTRHLVGKDSTRDLGLDGRVSLVSRALFVLGFSLVRGIDAVGRLVIPGFSISRLVTRILGYQLTAKLLMDETRPLQLPATLLNEVGAAVRGWHNDPKAPRWMNALERYFTGRRAPPTVKDQ